MVVLKGYSLTIPKKESIEMRLPAFLSRRDSVSPNNMKRINYLNLNLQRKFSYSLTSPSQEDPRCETGLLGGRRCRFGACQDGLGVVVHFICVGRTVALVGPVTNLLKQEREMLCNDLTKIIS